MMKKQFMAILTLAALLLALLPVSALAAEEFVVKNGVLTAYNGAGGSVTIPAGVTEIGEKAFFNKASVKSVIIPEGVTKIGPSAFSFCTGLTSVSLPQTLTAIDKAAFQNCGDLTGVVVPGSTKVIGDDAFAQCIRLQSATLNWGIQEIGSTAFARTAISTLTIPSTVTKIGDGAFSNNEKLKTLTLYAGLVSIGKSAFAGDKLLESVDIPSTVTSIGDEAFARCGSLSRITVPPTIPSMGKDIITATTSKLEIFGMPGSAAESLAKSTHGATFVPLEQTAQAGIAYASTQLVLIDGFAQTLQAYALKDANGNDTNYVKIRDVALFLDGTPAQFNVGWADAVNIETKKGYASRNGQENKTPYSGNQYYEDNTAPTKVNGSAVALDSFIIKDAAGNGSIYYKLRDLGRIIGFNVGWDAERGIYLETDKPYQG